VAGSGRTTGTVIIKLTKFNCQCNSKLELSLAIPRI
jgi:hypothetical protein